MKTSLTVAPNGLIIIIGSADGLVSSATSQVTCTNDDQDACSHITSLEHNYIPWKLCDLNCHATQYATIAPIVQIPACLSQFILTHCGL